MMTLRKKSLIIASVSIAILIFIVVLIVVFNKSGEGNNVDSQGENSDVYIPEGKTNDPVNTEYEAVSQIDQEEAYTKQLAKIFVERFSSFSNQNDNVHIDDALELSTVRMQGWIKNQSVDRSLVYEGVTTEVFSTSIKENSGTSAVIEIAANQIIYSDKDGIMEEEMIQKKGRVELLKENGEWKVNGLYWD